jgi:predicted nuclease of predicted toxin-antitoxin system
LNFVADEGLDRPIVERLRRDGHLVSYIVEMEAGISDESVLELANRKNALLLTSDKDFGELVFREKRLTQGVVLVRLAGFSPQTKAAMVASAVAKHGTELSQAFTVISPKLVRIRPRQL